MNGDTHLDAALAAFTTGDETEPHQRPHEGIVMSAPRSSFCRPCRPVDLSINAPTSKRLTI